VFYTTKPKNHWCAPKQRNSLQPEALRVGLPFSFGTFLLGKQKKSTDAKQVCEGSTSTAGQKRRQYPVPKPYINQRNKTIHFVRAGRVL
jgi:hypothetical protein